jgi:LPS-assembly protein
MRYVIAIVLVAIVAAAEFAAAADDAFGIGLGALGKSTGEVTVDAESITYDQQTNVVTAHGAVKVTRGDMVLTADTVRVNRTTQQAAAEGNVVLVDPQGTVTADSMSLNLVEETGELGQASVFLNKNHYQLTGAHFEKLPGQSYRVEKGRFTTCICGEGAPSWSVRGEKVTVDVDGYGKVERGVFEVKGVPILYVPYGLFPIRRERQSGFLFPRFGFSNRRGFQFEQPLYVDINKSMDATVAVDVETEARVGVLGEYRYALSEKTAGEITGSYFNEEIRGASSQDIVNQRIADPNIPVDRWSAGMVHDQWLPYGVRGFTDVFRVSDDLFLREINLFTFNPSADVALRTRRYDRTRAGVERVFDRGLLIASGTWYQDFINPDPFVFQVPPRVSGTVVQRVLDDRVALSLTGEGANFARERGFEGQRIDVRPEVEVPWRFSPYVYGSWRGGFRETAYTLADTSVPPQVNVNPADPGSKPPSILPALDDDATRELFYVNGEVHTAVARVMPFHRFGIAAVKHTIEPSVNYLFVPRSDARQSALPLFDDVDRINRRSVFTYGVTSRLVGRMDAGTPAVAEEPIGPGYDPEARAIVESRAAANGATPSVNGASGAAARGPIRELGRFSIFQSYDVLNKGGDFIDEVDPETGKVVPRDATRVSDLGLHLHAAPTTFVTFDGRTDFDVVNGRAKGANLYLALSDPRNFSDDFSLVSLRGRSRLSVGYRFVANSAIEEVNGGLLFRLSKRYYGAFQARYDNLSKKFLEVGGGLRVISDCECWVLDVGVSDRVNPNETQARVLISLVGLGQFGREPFGSTYGNVAGPARGVLGE